MACPWLPFSFNFVSNRILPVPGKQFHVNKGEMYKLKEYLSERTFGSHDTGRNQNVADTEFL